MEAKKLPIEKHKQEILQAVAQNSVVIIEGETGSGKTTQVPQYLFEAGYGASGLIGVTQPRRIAAISITEYVAKALGTPVGGEVGYQIRFDDETSVGTRIKFMTDGILLQEAKSDPSFMKYDVLVFDEAHERGLNTDFCLGLAKRALALRNGLKIIVMSATLDAKSFSDFFGAAPVISVSGRMFPVEVRHIEQSDIETAQSAFDGAGKKRNLESLAALAVERICNSQEDGDILVFMPGAGEINQTIEFIEQLGLPDLQLFPMHGSMRPEDQHKIFDETSARKVIVATNIAETSITVDGVVHVVDSGVIREKNYNPPTGISTLHVVEHSRAGLEQRRGRAGRTRAGICWRLFLPKYETKARREYQREWFAENEERPEFTKPEIQRSELSSVVLRLLGIGIKDVESFEFLDQPSHSALIDALGLLKDLGAVTAERDVTEMGHQLLDLPLEPKIGRMILEAERLKCVDEILAIAASLSARNIFVRPDDQKDEADAAKLQFTDPRSDFFTTLCALYAYEDTWQNRQWAYDHFLNARALNEIINVREQLRDILTRMGKKISRCGYSRVRRISSLDPEQEVQGQSIGKAITAGLVQNVLRRGGAYSYQHRIVDSVYLHPSSVLFQHTLDAEFVVAVSLVKPKDKVFAQGCQLVRKEWLEEVAPHLYKREERPALFGSVIIDEYFNGIRVGSYTRREPEATPQEHELDDVTLARLSRLYDGITKIEQNPHRHGYIGLYQYYAYNLRNELESAERLLRRGSADEGKYKLLQIKKRVESALERAAKIEQQRVAREEKRRLEEVKLHQQSSKEQERQEYECEYQARLADLKGRCGNWPGFGLYRLECDSHDEPIVTAQKDGSRCLFDLDSTECLLPEHGKRHYWGYITQWGLGSTPNLVVALMYAEEKSQGA